MLMISMASQLSKLMDGLKYEKFDISETENGFCIK